MSDHHVNETMREQAVEDLTKAGDTPDEARQEESLMEQAYNAAVDDGEVSAEDAARFERNADHRAKGEALEQAPTGDDA
jgi:hypothetical protein